MTLDMTRGSPAKLILQFSLPLFIGNLFQQFYNMADTFIVGRTLGAGALAAVGCTGGHHRSVAIAHALAERIRGQGWPVAESHRDLGRN